MNIRVWSVISGVVMLLVPMSVARAAPVLRSGESVTVSETQEVPDDFYAAGTAVTVSGKIIGDLYAAGGTVIANGEVTEDVVALGGSVHIDGTVGDDVRIIGGDVVLSDTVKGDVLVMGGAVHILSTARIDGDVLFFGGELVTDGEVRGSLSGRAESVRINGPVLGDVSVTVARALELGDQAHIEGTVTYASDEDIARAPGSVVLGDITKSALLGAASAPSFHALPLLALFFTTLAYLFIFRHILGRLMRHTLGTPGRNGLLGIGVFVTMPIAAVALMVSVVGLPVGIALLLFYALLCTVAMSLAGIGAGAALSRYFVGEVVVSLKWTLLGTLALVLISYIPYIGPLALAVVTLTVAGGIASMCWGQMRR